MKLSVIIPTYNRFNSLKSTLKSIFKYLPSHCEVIVIDQSEEALKNMDYFKNRYSDLIYIHEKRKNLPNARNLGIKISSGGIVLFFDDDIIMHKNCIESHIKAHKELSSSIIAGRIIQSGEVQWADINDIAWIDTKNAETKANFDNLKFHQNIKFAVGSHFSIKKSVFKKVGFFDKAYCGNALYEDIDFSFRIKKLAYEISFYPKAVIEHHTELTGGCRTHKSRKYNLNMLHNRTLFYLKNISFIPSIQYIIYLRNLSEYICRIKKGFYSPYYFCKVIYSITIAYYHCITSKLRTRI